jgi:hypothetical protein
VTGAGGNLPPRAAIVVVVVVVATVAGTKGVTDDTPGVVAFRSGRVVRGVLDAGAVDGGTVERGRVVGGAVVGGVVRGAVLELKVGSVVRGGAAVALDA